MQLILWMFALAGARAQADDVDAWLAQEKTAAVQLLLGNVSPSGCAPGAVVASPSKDHPNYFFHWVRDSGLTMDAVVGLYERSRTAQERQAYFQVLSQYVDFSRQNQQTPNPSGGADDLGLGEPKFNCDGTAFNHPWGRPQNDGPALRAIALTHFAWALIRQGRTDLVRGKLGTVINLDLEFVARHWGDASFDLWEEVKGKQFYTKMVQRRALLEGAQLARTLGDGAAVSLYLAQAAALEPEIRKHWDAGRGFIVATLDVEGGIQGKSGLDSAVVLGALHGCAADGFFCPGDPQIMATALKLEQVFNGLYPLSRTRLNPQGEAMGTPIGRYPEDTYSGEATRDGGNPWFLLTNAFAELYLKSGQTEKAQTFLRRVRFHSGGNASISEQYNRTTGIMQSARDLTWNYASFLSLPN